MPAIYYFECNAFDNISYNFNVIVQRTIGDELDRILDSKYIQASDIGFICNNTKREGWLNEMVEKRTGKRNCVCNLKDTYSAEWPVVVFLMDLEDVDEFDYTLPHQLYLRRVVRGNCAILAKYRQIPPDTAKYRQIPPNTAKYRQIPRNTA